MKFCTKCSAQNPEDSKFCNRCGAGFEPQHVETAEEKARREEQECLDSFNTALKHERLTYKICGIYYLVNSILILLISFFMALSTAAVVYGEPKAVFPFAAMTVSYFSMGIVYLVVAIINLVMKNKLDSYRGQLYNDCTKGIGHYSVGSIVFSAFFNNIALVFVIIYFVKAKNKKEVIDRIKANQSAFNSQH